MANEVPLCYGVAGYVPPANLPPSLNTCSTVVAATKVSPAVKSLQTGWQKMKAQYFVPKYHTPDSLDPDTVSHFDWYEATGYKIPYPGEKTVRPASDFKKAVHAKVVDNDD